MPHPLLASDVYESAAASASSSIGYKTPRSVQLRWFSSLLSWVCVIVASIGLGGAAAHAATAPVLQGRVNDYAHVLGDHQAPIEAMLAEHERATGHQVVVLTVATLAGQDIESYANDVFAQWKLGRKGVDDGVLIVVAVNDHRVRIEVGYGLEGSLTDLDSARIIRERMRPHFSDGDYGAGVQEGVNGVLGVLGENPAAAPAVKETSHQVIAREGFWKSGAAWAVLIVAIFCLLFAWLGSQGGGVWALLLLIPLPLLVLLAIFHWSISAITYLATLGMCLVWRRRTMHVEYKLGKRTRKRKCTVQTWPPTVWAVLTWSGPFTGGLASSGGGRGGSSSGSGSSSSGYSGGGGSSGGGGASGSW